MTQSIHNSSVSSTHDESPRMGIKPLTDTSLLPQPYPRPILIATFKKSAADFKVDEVLDLTLSGAGEHLWLKIQKSNMNTAYVAELLAKWANIPKRDVGYSGMKDRQAVTTQWFSLRLPKAQLPDSDFGNYVQQKYEQQKASAQLGCQPENSTDQALKVLDQSWHQKKLNRGTHKANRFVITLHGVMLNTQVASTIVDVDTQLQQIAKQGVPNYFGAQRFGRKGNNVIQAIEWFEKGTINGRKPHPKRSRDLQSLLLSAARSVIFNQVLAARVQDGSWHTGLDGEVFNLAGSGSVFSAPELEADLIERVAKSDIYPTGPLWGINNSKVSGHAKLIEDQIVSQSPYLQQLANGLQHKQIKAMRRPLRTPIMDLQWQWFDTNTLQLSFTLNTGSFATSVLASLIEDLH